MYFRHNCTINIFLSHTHTHKQTAIYAHTPYNDVKLKVQQQFHFELTWKNLEKRKSGLLKSVFWLNKETLCSRDYKIHWFVTSKITIDSS